MAGSRTLKLTILGDVDNLNKSLKAATKDVDTFGDKMTKAGKVVGAALVAAAAAAGAMAIKIGVDSVKAASDLSETISKVGVLFGSTSKEIEKFASQAASSLGQTKQEALDAAATFATFGKAAGLSGKDLSDFSIDFVKLSSDLASFNNTSPEQAINAIGAALRGEAEPLRQYGVLLDDASMRQKALELGIISTTKQALTPQQKVLAAQALIFEQTGAAQGDFARTSDGLANRTRILTAQLENAKTTIGTALLPIVLQLATFISDKVIPIVEEFTNSFSSNPNGFAGVITTTGKVIVNTFTPIINGLIKAFGYVRDAIGDNLDTFKEFGGYIAQYLAPVIGTVLGGALQAVGKIAAGLIDIIAGVVKVINGLIGGAIDGINAVIRAYNAIPLLPNVPTVSKPAVSAPTVSSSSVPSITLPKVPSVSVPSVSGSSSGTAGASSSAAKATKQVAATGASVMENYRLNQLASPVTVAPTINIGVAGDPEGTARTIVDVLNRSYGRGALGAGALTL